MRTIPIAFTVAACAVSLAAIGARPTVSISVWVGIGTAIVALVTVSGSRSSATAALALAGAALTLSDGGIGTSPQWDAGLSTALPPIVVASAASSISTRPRLALALAFVAAILGGPVAAVLEDPLAHPNCDSCASSAFSLWPDAAASVLCATIGAGALAGALCGLTLGTRRGRVFAGLTALAAVILLIPSASAVQWGASVAALTASTAAVVRFAQSARARRRLALLSASTGGRNTSGALRAALDDPALRIIYPQPDGTWADEAGAITQPHGAGRNLESEGMLVARIEGDSTDRIDTVLTPELLAGLEEGRLSAALAADIVELRASRLRVVRHADDERRASERDLHDGSQQHLLAFGLALRAAAATSTPPQAQGMLQEAVAEIEVALGELREVAHGLYPPVLTASGVEAAASDLARRMRARVSFSNSLPRFAPVVERTLYLAIAAALTSHEDIAVEGTVDGDDVMLRVITPYPQPSPILVERVAAVGGILGASPSGQTHVWTVRMPCA
ncbi:sensor histidine kinase [Microbacterium sp.]|uniref:sensor histidine kinase n=1 Tax=Microbacterium sp. TaxID=51671 RepID=UPI003C741DED